MPTAVTPDDELSIPITVAEIQQSDTMPPPLMEQLARVVEIGEGLWPLRRQIERIESNVAGIAKATTRHEALLDDLLRPQLETWRYQTESIAQQIPKFVASIESMTLLIGDVDRRLRAVEKTVEKLVDRVHGDSEDVESALARAEKERAEMRLELAALKEAALIKATASTAIAKRDKWWIAAITAVVGFAAGSLPTVISFIRNHF